MNFNGGGMKWSWPTLRTIYISIYLEGLRKTSKKRQDIPRPCQDSNLKLPEYKSEHRRSFHCARR